MFFVAVDSLVVHRLRMPIYHIIVYHLIMNTVFWIGPQLAYSSNPVKKRSIIFVQDRYDWGNGMCSYYPNHILSNKCIHGNWVPVINTTNYVIMVYLSSDNTTN